MSSRVYFKRIRELNYDKLFKEGDTKRVTIEEFDSNNTRILNLEETKEKMPVWSQFRMS